VTKSLATSILFHGALVALLAWAVPKAAPREKLSFVDSWTLAPSPGKAKRGPVKLPVSPPGAAPARPAGDPDASTGPPRTSTVALARLVAEGNDPPTYPLAALEKGYQGVVTLKLHRGEDGRVARADVLNGSGFLVLDRAAIDAAEKWKLGSELPAEVVVPIHFRIQE